ncbi:hypothetical protein CF326_g9026 [Tilletia indica]|nr:hypothetical protein CF326_g9026 [Tilletia indica]
MVMKVDSSSAERTTQAAGTITGASSRSGIETMPSTQRSPSLLHSPPHTFPSPLPSTTQPHPFTRSRTSSFSNAYGSTISLSLTPTSDRLSPKTFHFRSERPARVDIGGVSLSGPAPSSSNGIFDAPLRTRHAQISLTTDELFLQDLGDGETELCSTQVNDVPVYHIGDGSYPIRLHSGDILQFGHYQSVTPPIFITDLACRVDILQNPLPSISCQAPGSSPGSVAYPSLAAPVTSLLPSSASSRPRVDAGTSTAFQSSVKPTSDSPSFLGTRPSLNQDPVRSPLSSVSPLTASSPSTTSVPTSVLAGTTSPPFSSRPSITSVDALVVTLHRIRAAWIAARKALLTANPATWRPFPLLLRSPEKSLLLPGAASIPTSVSCSSSSSVRLEPISPTSMSPRVRSAHTAMRRVREALCALRSDVIRLWADGAYGHGSTTGGLNSEVPPPLISASALALLGRALPRRHGHHASCLHIGSASSPDVSPSRPLVQRPAAFSLSSLDGRLTRKARLAGIADEHQGRRMFLPRRALQSSVFSSVRSCALGRTPPIQASV